MFVSAPETCRAHERFPDERGLPKAAILIECTIAQLEIRLVFQAQIVRRDGSEVHLAIRAEIPLRRLTMTLAADQRGLLMVETRETEWGTVGVGYTRLPGVHGLDVRRRRSVAHLAIDARLAKGRFLQRLVVEPHQPQLAGVARRAVSLVTGGVSQHWELIQLGPLAAWRVDQRPIVQPPLFDGTVLDRKDEQPLVGQLR